MNELFCINYNNATKSNDSNKTDMKKDEAMLKENIELGNTYRPINKAYVESTIRPQHYGGENNPYEVFNVLEAWGLDKDFYLGNVIKYIARAGKKDPTKEIEDLEKAEVYLKRRIKELKK